jgi:hypothetical protein
MGKIVFMGDSLTAALEVPHPTDRWTYRVGIHNNYAPADIVNKGVSGNNSNQMLARFYTDVMSYAAQIDVLVFMFTVNDKTNGLTLAQSEANYKNMIGQAKAVGIKVVLITPNLYTSDLPSWNPWCELWDKIAGDTGCYFIDVWKEFVWNTFVRPDWFAFYYADYAHTNTNGNGLIYLITRKQMHDTAGAFLKAQAPPQTGASELVLSLADLAEKGATEARLQRALAALT